MDQQRFNVEFCSESGEPATETHETSVQVYGPDAVSRKCVYDRFAQASNRWRTNRVRGRPSTSGTAENIERARVSLAKDRRLTLAISSERSGY